MIGRAGRRYYQAARRSQIDTKSLEQLQKMMKELGDDANSGLKGM